MLEVIEKLGKSPAFFYLSIRFPVFISLSALLVLMAGKILYFELGFFFQ